jgi:hypothetical protein
MFGRRWHLDAALISPRRVLALRHGLLRVGGKHAIAGRRRDQQECG